MATGTQPALASLPVSTWEERAAEAPQLLRQLGSADVDVKLLDLLLDPEDTAVTQAVAEGLLGQDNTTGLRLFVIAFGRADEDTRNKLGDCLYDDSGHRWRLVAAALPPLAAAAAADVRHGAAVLLEHMRQQARYHDQ